MAPVKKVAAKEVAAPVKKKAEAKSTSSITADIENAVAAEFECTKKVAKELVKFIFTKSIELVKATSRLQIADFGILSVMTVGPRDGRNPKTGEPMKLKATKKITFKASKSFKDYVRSK